MDTHIRILILEDNASDAELMKRELRKAGLRFTAECAQDKGSFLGALGQLVPDIILADYALPGFDGLTALALARRRFPDVPVILVSGQIGEEVAIDSLKAGAADYVLKQRLSRLAPVVHRALQETTQRRERRRAEEALREQQKELRLIMDGGPTAIAYVGSDCRYRRVNKTYERWLGLAAEEVRGREVREVLGAEGWQAIEPHVQRALAGEVVTCEQELPLPGGPRWVHATYTPDRDESGRVRGFVVHAGDIGQRKRMEEALLQAKAAAEEANEAKTRFLANVSHELRTPMNAILGMVDLALPKAQDATLKDYLQTAKESADLLLALLDDLLDCAKIEAGRLELESAPFSLRRVLDQTRRVLAVRASEKGLSFSCRFPGEVPDALVGDQFRLRQILFNLAGNAIKFTQRGEVEVRVRVSPRPLAGEGQGMRAGADVGASAEQSPHPSPLPEGDGTVMLEFAVRDTGIGIPPSESERIFRPFAQADPSTPRRFGGTGLGLTISSSLVAMMGGRIWVQSSPGQGSTFYFTVRLPPAKDLPPQPEFSFDVAAVAPRRLRVLLVEDNPANQKLAAYLLRDRGHTVEIAEDGSQAHRMAQESEYDVILMDLHMPGMDGLETAAAIRAGEGEGRHTPIIALTAYAMKEDRERCLAGGMDGYLSKPIVGREMIALVESLATGLASPETDAVSFPADPPEPAAPPVAGVFDPELALRRCFSSPDMLRQMVQCFFDEADSLLPQMRSALEQGDLAQLGGLAHRLKGTVVYLGAEPAAKAASRLERFDVSGGQQAEAEEAVRALEHHCQVLKAAITRGKALGTRNWLLGVRGSGGGP